ncbi:hypothetical protein EDD22DRAFT_852906 [Suillus occidentalis]|nr:hypothetical protein EDD22DRAFT_852906 [Suillus occidentalis]
MTSARYWRQVLESDGVSENSVMGLWLPGQVCFLACVICIFIADMSLPVTSSMDRKLQLTPRTTLQFQTQIESCCGPSHHCTNVTSLNIAKGPGNMIYDYGTHTTIRSLCSSHPLMQQARSIELLCKPDRVCDYPALAKAAATLLCIKLGAPSKPGYKDESVEQQREHIALRDSKEQIEKG